MNTAHFAIAGSFSNLGLSAVLVYMSSFCLKLFERFSVNIHKMGGCKS